MNIRSLIVDTKVTKESLDSMSDEALKSLTVRGSLNGESGLFRKFRRDSSGRVVFDFLYDKPTASGMRRSSNGNYTTHHGVSFD